GFSANAILAEEIGEEWVKVRLPLSEFEWEAVNGANPSNIKQFIIQFEADGDIYVDDIKIVEFNGSYRKRATVNLVEKSAISIDGEIEKAWGKPAVELNNQKVYMHTDNEFLYVATAFVDQSPLQNSNDNGSIWNGDALEIAFSSAAIQGKPSPYLKSINHHFGIRLNGEPIIWDWQKQKEIDCESKITSNGNNVFYETKIPLAHFGDFNFAHGQVYGFEVAIDQGNKKGRETQMRWNSSSNDGFHQNPTLWGEMIINQVIN
ncbi:MAG: sugar-binding protein, partial [Bacteroidia bacterium]